MYKLNSNPFVVPQGSILGPMLFNIFINDTIKINSFPGITTIYADDVKLLLSDTSNILEQKQANK